MTKSLARRLLRPLAGPRNDKREKGPRNDREGKRSRNDKGGSGLAMTERGGDPVITRVWKDLAQ